MDPNEEYLKALLLNARLIYIVKAQAVEFQLSGNHAEVNAINDQLDNFFGHVANPKLWTDNIPYDPGTVAQQILDISAVQATDVPKYLLCTRNFLQLMQQEVLKVPLQRIASTTTNAFNLRMINTLTKNQRIIDNRVAFLNLKQNEEFQGMESHQKALVSNFRQLLASNAVLTNQSKVNLMTQRGLKIDQTNTVPEFLNLYQKLSDFIELQIANTSLIPLFGTIPVANNQQALDALAVTLVKIARTTAILRGNGIDLDSDSSFQQLQSKEEELAQNFRRALYTNTFEATTDDVKAIQDLGKDIENASDKNTFLDKYQEFQQLMKDNSAATA